MKFIRYKFDKLWLWNLVRCKGLSPKLELNWNGPYTVLKKLNDFMIRIQKSLTSKPSVIHYDRLAPLYNLKLNSQTMISLKIFMQIMLI